MFTTILIACNEKTIQPRLNQQQLASHYFQNDTAWYLQNIPFFECSDTSIEQVYYYRWKLYKAHIRNTGENSHVITEFINHVAWDQDPHCTINAASMHHIYEGRWLKDDRYMNGYIDYLFHQGGNNRHYSESIADAAFARYLVNADTAFLFQQLDSMCYQYTLWNDHWDSSKQLYYIPAMPDATEYTIASIDASGGTAGFDGGDAFRPTINSYMYANALAISKIAAMKGDQKRSREYADKAAHLKSFTEKWLWNDSLQHFTDRFKQDNRFVHYWDFIRGRELAGMIPWYFNLPADNKNFGAAWKHVTDTNYLLGFHGLRTNEPSYEYYFRQFVWYEGQRGSQWNGPSWPYQSSQVITGMANLLQNYNQHQVTNSEYLHLLRLFTRQHYLPDGRINLVENYDPNLGGPIVYYYWSNHYNHSSYNNLVISGLCGIIPSADDTLRLNPLIDSSIRYFFLDDLRYHGHKLSVIYDLDGTKYNTGKGLSVWVDGKKAALKKKVNKYEICIGAPLITPPVAEAKNMALNISRKVYPKATASVNNITDSVYQAIDGRIWYFTEITNRWTSLGSLVPADWIALDFGQSQTISAIKVYPFADNKTYYLPDSIRIEYLKENQWHPLKIKGRFKLIANTGNTIPVEKNTVQQIRVLFFHKKGAVAVSELECY